MKILAFDPGKDNFAYAVLDKNGKVKEHGFVRTATDLSADKLHDGIGAFIADIEKLLIKHGPDFVAIERMQHRPKFGGGSVVEYINIMIGAVLTLTRQHRYKTFAYPAATWKAHMKKLFKWTKGQPFTMQTDKFQVKAPKGTMRKFKGKMVPVKKATVEVRGAVADQPRAANLTPHEADAAGIAAYCWYRITKINVVERMLT